MVKDAIRPFPRPIGDDKLLVWGRGRGGRLLQAIFVLDHDGIAFVIHGRELTSREKASTGEGGNDGQEERRRKVRQNVGRRPAR